MDREISLWIALPSAVTYPHAVNISNLKEIPKDDRQTIGGVAGQRVEIVGTGDITLQLASGEMINLTNVKFVPNAIANIFAVRAALIKLGADGRHIEQTRSTKLLKGNKTILTSTSRGGFYYLDLHARGRQGKIPHIAYRVITLTLPFTPKPLKR